MWIPADAENMDLAKEFVKFMYSDTVVDLMLNNKVVNKETNEESAAPIVSPVLWCIRQAGRWNNQRYLYTGIF